MFYHLLLILIPTLYHNLIQMSRQKIRGLVAQPL
nr:MAG TPA: hypothetical protein [Caudoviricetes sp.]